MVRRLIYFIVAALVLAGCSSERDNILKVYNWADYIDEELLGGLNSGMRNRQGRRCR